MPRPVVALPCGSRSTTRTRCSFSASAAPRFTVVVVLPTPPFWLATAMTRGSGRSRRMFGPAGSLSVPADGASSIAGIGAGPGGSDSRSSGSGRRRAGGSIGWRGASESSGDRRRRCRVRIVEDRTGSFVGSWWGTDGSPLGVDEMVGGFGRNGSVTQDAPARAVEAGTGRPRRSGNRSHPADLTAKGQAPTRERTLFHVEHLQVEHDGMRS